MDKFWRVLNLANVQNGIFGGDLIWRMMNFIKFGEDLLWRTGNYLKFGGDLFWQMRQRTKLLYLEINL